MLKKIEVFDILRRNRRLLRRHFRIQPDDTHLNDVEPLPASMEDEYPLFKGGDLLVSLRDLNVVLVVNPTTLEVQWWVARPFIRQHDPDFVGGGWIGIFDNQWDGTDRGRRFGGSRIVAIQPHTDSTVVRYSSYDGSRFYTDFGGNWQALENGNSLLTENIAGRIIEVDREGRVVWEWIHTPYSSTRVPAIYWAERYNLTPDQVANWPCSPGDSSRVE